MTRESAHPCIVWFGDDLRLSETLRGPATRPKPAARSPLPASLIHLPWSAAPLELKGAGIDLGQTYPEPVIDHRAGHERALKAYAKARAA